MTTNQDAVRSGRWARTLEELDHEVGRLAMLCRVPILESGVIERVLHGDRLVCGTDNPVAFAKLRDLLMMHFAVHAKWAAQVGRAGGRGDRRLRDRAAAQVAAGARRPLAAGVTLPRRMTRRFASEQRNGHALHLRPLGPGRLADRRVGHGRDGLGDPEDGQQARSGPHRDRQARDALRRVHQRVQPAARRRADAHARERRRSCCPATRSSTASG